MNPITWFEGLPTEGKMAVGGAAAGLVLFVWKPWTKSSSALSSSSPSATSTPVAPATVTAYTVPASASGLPYQGGGYGGGSYLTSGSVVTTGGSGGSNSGTTSAGSGGSTSAGSGGSTSAGSGGSTSAGSGVSPVDGQPNPGSSSVPNTSSGPSLSSYDVNANAHGGMWVTMPNGQHTKINGVYTPSGFVASNKSNQQKYNQFEKSRNNPSRAVYT